MYIKYTSISCNVYVGTLTRLKIWVGIFGSDDLKNIAKYKINANKQWSGVLSWPWLEQSKTSSVLAFYVT